MYNRQERSSGHDSRSSRRHFRDRSESPSERFEEHKDKHDRFSREVRHREREDSYGRSHSEFDDSRYDGREYTKYESHSRDLKGDRYYSRYDDRSRERDRPRERHTDHEKYESRDYHQRDKDEKYRHFPRSRQESEGRHLKDNRQSSRERSLTPPHEKSTNSLPAHDASSASNLKISDAERERQERIERAKKLLLFRSSQKEVIPPPSEHYPPPNMTAAAAEQSAIGGTPVDHPPNQIEGVEKRPACPPALLSRSSLSSSTSTTISASTSPNTFITPPLTEAPLISATQQLTSQNEKSENITVSVPQPKKKFGLALKKTNNPPLTSKTLQSAAEVATLKSELPKNNEAFNNLFEIDDKKLFAFIPLQNVPPASSTTGVRSVVHPTSLEDFNSRDGYERDAKADSVEHATSIQEDSSLEKENEKLSPAKKTISEFKIEEDVVEKEEVLLSDEEEVEEENRQKQWQLAASVHEPVHQMGYFALLKQETSHIPLSSASNISKKEALSLLAVANDSKKKTLAEYPLTKELYTPVTEISSLKDHEVEAIRDANGRIKVRGRGAPKPILTFHQCGLDPSTIALLTKSRDFDKPSPIQMQAIPALMSGRDVIGIAQTGSGKTLAYLLPLLKHVYYQEMGGLPSRKHTDGPTGLVLTPTRELAMQVKAEATKLCRAMYMSLKGVELSVAAVVGGVSIVDNLREFKRGCQIVCATPGRLIDVLTTNNGKVVSLRRVTILILDEADRMFDMGFGEQVETICSLIREDRQVGLFSATFPLHIEGLARRLLVKPLEITVGERGKASDQVKHFVEVHSDNKSKFKSLLKLLGEWCGFGGKVLIFVSQQKAADSLFAELSTFGHFSLVLHAGMDPVDRTNAIQDYKDGVASILITTSIAARGLDVPNIALVINMDAPDHAEDFVHRVGRTGRGNNLGVSYTFLLASEGEKAEEVVRIIKASGQDPGEAALRLAEEYKRNINYSVGGTAGDGKRSAKGFGGSGFCYSKGEGGNTKKIRELRMISEEDEEEEVDEEDKVFVDENGDVIMTDSALPVEESLKNLKDSPPPTSSSSRSTVAPPPSMTAASSKRGGTPNALQPSLQVLPPLNLQEPSQKLAHLESLRSSLLNSLQSFVGFTLPPPPCPSAPIYEIWAWALSLRPNLQDRQAQVMKALKELRLAQGNCQILMHPNVHKRLCDGKPVVSDWRTFKEDESDEQNGHHQIIVAESINQTLSSINALKNRLLNVVKQQQQEAPSSSSSSALAPPQNESVPRISQNGALVSVDFILNDYPLPVRLRMTHRDELTPLSDQLGVSITPKGQYYPPGASVPPGAKKLSLELQIFDSNAVGNGGFASVSRILSALSVVRDHTENMSTDLLIKAKQSGTLTAFMNQQMNIPTISKYSEM